LRLLLDSCAFIWLCSDPERLSKNAVDAISNNRDSLFLSDASVFEISIKHSIGKLNLPESPENWITQQTGIWGIQQVELTRHEIFESAKLPWLHKDPFDRLIIATAKNHALKVITSDQFFPKYSVDVIW